MAADAGSRLRRKDVVSGQMLSRLQPVPDTLLRHANDPPKGGLTVRGHDRGLKCFIRGHRERILTRLYQLSTRIL